MTPYEILREAGLAGTAAELIQKGRSIEPRTKITIPRHVSKTVEDGETPKHLTSCRQQISVKLLFDCGTSV